MANGFICLLVVVSSLDLCAQSASTGALTGTVTDPTGAVLQNAQITLRNSGTGESRTATTDRDGSYRLSLLPPGEYELTVEAVGFAPLVVREVLIRITEVRSLATQLAVKGVRQDLVVEAPLLQTDNVALGRVIARDTIVGLPLVNRNFTQILGLTAGTNTDVVDATLLGAGSQEIRANGARSSDNNFMLNGVDANSYGGNMTEATNNSGGGLAIPAPDTIEEFKVQNSLYDAQYGRGGGANVLVETKSGTAQFHGNAYYFGRDDALNANNFFANATGVPKGDFRRHQPGATLGGPIPWVQEPGLFLRFLPGHTGRECGVARQQCAITQSAADSGRAHARLFGSDLRWSNRALRWRGDRAGWIKHQSGGSQPAEREESGWIVCHPEPADCGQRRQLHGCLARTLRRRPVQYQRRREPGQRRQIVGEVLLFELASEPAVLRRNCARVSGTS